LTKGNSHHKPSNKSTISKTNNADREWDVNNIGEIVKVKDLRVHEEERIKWRGS
jgi:hypothetical protein